MVTRRRKADLEEEEVQVVSLGLWKLTVGLASGGFSLGAAGLLWVTLQYFELREQVSVLNSSFLAVSTTVMPGLARIEETLNSIQIENARKEGAWSAQSPQQPPSSRSR